MKKNYKQIKGFTLVEITISVLILSIVMSLGYLFLNRSLIALERQRQSLDTLHEARTFLMNIERDLREATAILELDTIYRINLFDEENALLHKLVIQVPSKTGDGYRKVTYYYEGPELHQEDPREPKTLYREAEGEGRRAIITAQLDYIKVWGTDGTIFRNRYPEESMTSYRNYLRPHYYSPSNTKGLRDKSKIKGVEIQLSMHEIMDPDGKPIKQRVFVTRLYPRVLNPKYHQ